MSVAAPWEDLTRGTDCATIASAALPAGQLSSAHVGRCRPDGHRDWRVILMHLEVEEKFPVRSPAIFGEIRSVGEVAGHALRDCERHRIRHAYLDTDSGTLYGLGMSLRLREKGGGQELSSNVVYEAQAASST